MSSAPAVFERKFGKLPKVSSGLGLFQWKLRMGIHLAHHRDPMNRLIHFCAVQAAAFGLLLALTPISDLNIIGVGVKPTTAFIAFFFVLCSLLETGGAAWQSILLAVHVQAAEAFAASVDHNTALMTAAFSFTVVGFVIPVLVGHRLLEDFALDDSAVNLREALTNPIPLTLVVFYTNLEVLFELGYRPELAQEIFDISRALRPKLEVAAGAGSRGLAVSFLTKAHPSAQLQGTLSAMAVALLIGVCCLEVSMEGAMQARGTRTAAVEADRALFTAVLGTPLERIKLALLGPPLLAQLSKLRSANVLSFAIVGLLLFQVFLLSPYRPELTPSQAMLSLVATLIAFLVQTPVTLRARPSLLLLCLTVALNGVDCFFDIPALVFPTDPDYLRKATVNNTYHVDQFIHTVLVPIIVGELTIEYLYFAVTRRSRWDIFGLFAVALGAPIFLLGVEPHEKQLVALLAKAGDAGAVVAAHAQDVALHMRWIGFGHAFNTVVPSICAVIQAKASTTSRNKQA